MTKGIIKKVFEKYYTGGFEITIDDNDVMVIPSSHLEEFAKELIEEIKKQYEHDYWLRSNLEIMRTLIGDSK